jgi:REP element-mobilizing transposase RayT
MPEPKGWHSRGYLPHIDQPGLVQSITFHLHDSVPQTVLKSWKLELGLRKNTSADDPRQVELRKRQERYEDQGYGSCVLRQDDAATIVQDTLLLFDGQRYRLLAWCVMPNHVHALIETFAEHLLPDVIHSWKSFTASAINRITGARGHLWMADYFDRFIRDQAHLEAVIAYIENNSVKAGLVANAADWRYSSAGMRSR